MNLPRCYNKLVRPRLRAISLIAILILLAVLSSYFLLPGRNPILNVGDPSKPLPQDHSDLPFLFINMDPGYTTPPRILGVIVAIYPDGRIIRVVSESTVGQSYIRGRLSPEQVAKARRILHDSGLLSTGGRDTKMADAPTEQVGVRYGKLVGWWAHNPGFEKTKWSSATNPSITRLKKELLALPVEDPKPEPPKEWSRWPTEFYEGAN